MIVVQDNEIAWTIVLNYQGGLDNSAKKKILKTKKKLAIIMEIQGSA